MAPSDYDSYVSVTVNGSKSSCRAGSNCSFATDSSKKPNLKVAAYDDVNKKVSFEIELPTGRTEAPKEEECKVKFGKKLVDFKITESTQT